MIDLRGKTGRAANPARLRLAEALRDAGFPVQAAWAEDGRYDRQTSPYPIPGDALAADCGVPMIHAGEYLWVKDAVDDVLDIFGTGPRQRKEREA